MLMRGIHVSIAEIRRMADSADVLTKASTPALSAIMLDSQSNFGFDQYFISRLFQQVKQLSGDLWSVKYVKRMW